MLLFRDIMNTLATIGDLVKATEFIGQSSGLYLYSFFYFYFPSHLFLPKGTTVLFTMLQCALFCIFLFLMIYGTS